MWSPQWSLLKKNSMPSRSLALADGDATVGNFSSSKLHRLNPVTLCLALSVFDAPVLLHEAEHEVAVFLCFGLPRLPVNADDRVPFAELALLLQGAQQVDKD